MSLGKSIQQGTSDLSFILGTALLYSGGVSLCIMAVIGTIAVDLVILAFAEKNHNAFLTGFVLGSLLFRDSGPANPAALISSSLIMSGLAIGLAFGLGVPGVGIIIAAGWCAAAALCAVGMLFRVLGEALRLEDGEYENYSMVPTF